MSIVWTAHNPNESTLKRTVSNQLTLGPIAVKFLVVLVLALLSIFYLYQSNSSATKAYAVSDLQKQQQDLTAQNEELQYESERLKSLSQAENTAQQKGLVQVDNVDARVSQ
jgi:cell division protein FtsL